MPAAIAYGTIIGLRAITKGSAAKFSAQSLEREVPLPGFAIPANNASQFSFYDKLSRLAEEVYSGSKGNAVLSPQEKAYYQQQYDRLQALKEQVRPKRPSHRRFRRTRRAGCGRARESVVELLVAYLPRAHPSRMAGPRKPNSPSIVPAWRDETR